MSSNKRKFEKKEKRLISCCCKCQQVVFFAVRVFRFIPYVLSLFNDNKNR